MAEPGGQAAGGLVLEVRDLHVRRQDSERQFELHIERLEIRAGDRLALVGASGSGKSTALDLLSLGRQPDEVANFLFHTEGGEVEDIGQAWSADPSRLDRLRAVETGIVRQVAGLAPFLSLRRNIELSLRLAGRTAPNDRHQVAELAQALGVEMCLKAKPRRMSVGQQQRGAIARALVHSPRIIFADEPTSALDPDNAREVMSRFQGLSSRSGTAIVLATHDAGLAEEHGFQLCPLQMERMGATQIARLSHMTQAGR